MAKRSIYYKLLIAFCSITLFSCINDEDDPVDTVNYLKVGDSIPNFIVYNGQEEAFNSASFEGKHSLLAFYITTCPDCRRELPIIEEVWNNLKGDPNYLVITIAREQTAPAIEKYWKDNNLTVPTYLDPERQVYSMFANNTVPRLYLINSKREITEMFVNEVNRTADQLTEMIKSIKN